MTSPPIIVCCICREPITPVLMEETGPLRKLWLHGGQADHKPVPVAAAGGTVRHRCVFCSDLSAQWAFTCQRACRKRPADTSTFGMAGDARWLTCDPCKELVVSRDRAALIARAISSYRAHTGEEMPGDAREGLAAQYGTFFDAKLSGPEPINGRPS